MIISHETARALKQSVKQESSGDIYAKIPVKISIENVTALVPGFGIAGLSALVYVTVSVCM